MTYLAKAVKSADTNDPRRDRERTDELIHKYVPDSQAGIIEELYKLSRQVEDEEGVKEPAHFEEGYEGRPVAIVRLLFFSSRSRIASRTAGKGISFPSEVLPVKRKVKVLRAKWYFLP